MRHPRRNEVYRDVGSQLHEPGDTDFVDVLEIGWEPDAALLICSDGLTDLVPAEAIQRVVARHAGDPQAVARALVRAANEAGGKDNITVVYVEGERFPVAAPAPRRARRVLAHAAFWTLVAAAGIAAWRYYGSPVPEVVNRTLKAWTGNAIVVNPGAWTHYSWAIRDALEPFDGPVVEVHLSDVEAREEWRKLSVLEGLTTERVIGQGIDGYRRALELLAERRDA